MMYRVVVVDAQTALCQADGHRSQQRRVGMVGALWRSAALVAEAPPSIRATRTA